MNKNGILPAVAIIAGLTVGLAAEQQANADNLFGLTEVSATAHGQLIVGDHDDDHKCGSGSCGSDHKCGSDKNHDDDDHGDDHKCGAGSCGGKLSS